MNKFTITVVLILALLAIPANGFSMSRIRYSSTPDKPKKPLGAILKRDDIQGVGQHGIEVSMGGRKVKKNPKPGTPYVFGKMV
jgi:hypothetical protein